MSIPKSFDFIPIEAPGMTDAVNDALDKADELRQMFRETIQKLKDEASEAKRQLSAHQEKVHQAIELIDGKNINRAKMLLKVDGEFLRRTLPSKPSQREDFKLVYAESVEAMKMMTSKKQGHSSNALNNVFTGAEEMNLM